jgi:3-hydroxybutyryl-CoA dehydrogenase
MTADGPISHPIGGVLGPSAGRVERIGVVGAGTMGAGIAQIAALAGYETRLHDPVPAALDAGMERLRGALAKGAAKGMWGEEDADTARAGAGAAPSLADLGECDLVIEAAPEDLALKRELFAALADACGPDTILASNTSSLPVTAIAALVPHPERVVGMHFFNPPALMKLVEVVAAADSAAAALETTVEVGARMGRTPIRAKDSPGFIANRLARPFTLESLRMLADGVADAETIDRVCRLGGGFRMGPFELIDLIGLDVNLSVAQSFYAQGGEPERWRPSPIQEHLVEEGNLGRKSGRGFYAYDSNSSSAVPLHRNTRQRNSGAAAPMLDPGELAKIDPAAPEILPRLISQIANEAAFALEEEVGSPADMDTAMRLGFNWPLGPLEFADLIGAERALELLNELQRQHGDAYIPAPLLRPAAERVIALRATVF